MGAGVALLVAVGVICLMIGMVGYQREMRRQVWRAYESGAARGYEIGYDAGLKGRVFDIEDSRR